MMTETSTTLQLALDLAAVDAYVFPLDGKVPYRGESWPSMATTNETEIRRMWARHPGAEVGVHCGRSGWFVVDVDLDTDKGINGFEALHAAGIDMPPTLGYVTPRGGAHFLYRGVEGARPGVNVLGIQGVDIRAGAAYVRFRGTEAPGAAPSVEAPAELVEGALRTTETAAPQEHTVREFLDALIDGEPSAEVLDAVDAIREHDTSHQDLIRSLYRLARLGSEGHPGVLATMRAAEARYVRHYDDAQEQWDKALRSAIRKAPMPDDLSDFDPLTLFRKDAPATAGERQDEDPLRRKIDARRETLRIDRLARQEEAEAEAEEVEIPSMLGLGDLLAQEDETESWTVDGLLPTGGNVLLSAQYKAGKSTLVANLIRAVVDGGRFLDRFEVPATGSVVLLDFELSTGTLRRWLIDQGIEHVERVRVVSLRGRAQSFDVTNAATRRRWAELIGPADLLIVDPLRPILDALGLDENHEAGRFVVGLDALKAEAGIRDLVLVHHQGHAADRSRGDSRLIDWPDATWTLSREDRDDPSTPRFLRAYGRDVDVSEGALVFDEATRHLRFEEGTRRQAAGRAALERVLSLLSGADPMSGAAVEEALTGTMPRAAVRDALKLGQSTAELMTSKGAHNATLWSVAPAITGGLIGGV